MKKTLLSSFVRKWIKTSRNVKWGIAVSIADVSFAFNILFSVMFKEQYFLSYFTVFVFLLKLGKRDMSKNPNLSFTGEFFYGVKSHKLKRTWNYHAIRTNNSLSEQWALLCLPAQRFSLLTPQWLTRLNYNVKPFMFLGQMSTNLSFLGPVQTPYFTWAESNANEGEQRSLLICIWFGSCEVRRRNLASAAIDVIDVIIRCSWLALSSQCS